MALLGTIRNRFGWLMMGLIFVGIGSFLFMDASGPQNQMGGGSSKAGSVNGEKITREELRAYSQNPQYRGRLQEEVDKIVWDQIIASKLLDQKAKEAGFEVTSNEMGELFLSEDPQIMSELVFRQFGGKINQFGMKEGKANIDQIRQSLTTFKSKSSITNHKTYTDEQKAQLLEQYPQWKELEKSVYNDRLRNKYFSALDLGFYTPDWMVTMENGTRNTSYNFEYVSIPYTAVTGEGDVTEAEMAKYIAANARKYKTKASVGLDYVLFDVIATSEDSAMYKEEMTILADEFSKETDDTLFISSNDGQFAADYYTIDEMTEPAAIKDSILNVAKGTVVGPYLHNGQYRVVKAYDNKVMPDSVKARHIFYPAQNQQQAIVGRKLLDSLKKVIQEDPASFTAVADSFSKAPEKGGNLGWKGKSDVTYKDYLFFNGKKDSLEIIYSQSGLHLIQITDYQYNTKKKGVRLAIITKDIIPSDKTTKNVKRKVNDFIVANTSIAKMKEAAKKDPSLQMGSASSLKKGDFNIEGVGKNSAAAELIAWAHKDDTEEGAVSSSLLGIDNERLGYTEKYVVAAVTSKTPKGLASTKDPLIKAEVDKVLRNQKKAALVNTKLKELTTLDAIASNYGAAKKTAASVSYANATIPQAGTEPKVVALAANTPEGKVSKAIDGNEGIYVIRTIGKTPAPAISDLKNARRTITGAVSGAISGGIFQDMKDNTTIVDDRNTY